MGSTDTSVVPGVCVFVHGVCRCSTANLNLETQGTVSAGGVCSSYGQGAIHTILPFDWGDGDGRTRILIPPRFNHPGFPHWLGDGPILPTTKKAVPGNEPSLTSSAAAARVRREPRDPAPGAVPWCWSNPGCPAFSHVNPGGDSLAPWSCPAVSLRAQRRVQPLLLTPGSPGTRDLWHCCGSRGRARS